MKSQHYSRHAGDLKQALKDAIPHDVLKALHERSPWRHFVVVARQFLLLALSTSALWQHRYPLLWVPAALVQGFTIFNFTVLLHEVIHHVVYSRRRPGAERFLALLYAIPSGISASQFERWHLDHHANLGSPTDDPKRFHLSPKRNARWLKVLYMTPALFPIYFRAAGRENATYPEPLQRRIRAERLAATAFHLSVLAALLLVDWRVALRVEVVPVFFVFPIAFTLNRIGQHYCIDPTRPAGWSTLVASSPFWNFAFLNSNFHLEHHYFPGVPMYHLPELHERLGPFFAREGLKEHGYGDLLWGWLVKNRPPHANWDAAAGAAPSARPAA